MRTSRKTDFRKLKIALVTMIYHNQRPQCPSLSHHVLLVKPLIMLHFEIISDYSDYFNVFEDECELLRNHTH